MGRMNKKASKSIAMMVVQIASVLLAIIIIGYLVDYISSTTEEGMSIPKSTMEMAKTSLSINDITGFSIDSNNSDIEGLIMTVSPKAGSKAIDLGRSVVYIQVGNRTARLKIINGSTSKNKSSGFYTE